MQDQSIQEPERRDGGFTLIELLIAIVVVGILTTVVIVGIGSLQNSGQTATCRASADAAVAASNVHYANTTPSAWPADIEDMVTAKELTLPTGITAPASGVMTLTINTKTMTMAPGATASDPPSFSCA